VTKGYAGLLKLIDNAPARMLGRLSTFSNPVCLVAGLIQIGQIFKEIAGNDLFVGIEG
jgi:hypothetical protein